MTASPAYQPYTEPLWKTLRRTLLIALFVSALLWLSYARTVPFSKTWRIYLAVLWFPLGGHYVELAYLNWLRLTWPPARRSPRATRLVWWFLWGLPLGGAFAWTWTALGVRPAWNLPWWWGMPFFVAVEGLVHGVINVAGRPSFWNARE